MKISPEVEKTGQKEAGGLVDLAENLGETIPREIKTWMEKVEEEPVAGVTDQAGQPLLSPSQPTTVKIQLPISRKTFVAGFKKRIDEAGRWLSEFIFRLIKRKEGKVKFKEK